MNRFLKVGYDLPSITPMADLFMTAVPEVMHNSQAFLEPSQR